MLFLLLLLLWVVQESAGQAGILGPSSDFLQGSVSATPGAPPLCGLGQTPNANSWSAGNSPNQFTLQCPQNSLFNDVLLHMIVASSPIYTCATKFYCADLNGRSVSNTNYAGILTCPWESNAFEYSISTSCVNGYKGLGWNSLGGIVVQDNCGQSQTINSNMFSAYYSKSYSFSQSPGAIQYCPSNTTTGGTPWFISGVYGSGTAPYLSNVWIICNQNCMLCGGGTYTAVKGNVACTPCPGGTWGTSTGGTAKSTACPSGCPAGLWGVSTGSTSQSSACTFQCPFGTWGTTVGASSQAQACPNTCSTGTYTSALGATSSALGCIACPKGTFATNIGISVCTLCPANGVYSSIQGATQCAQCGAGTTTLVTGASMCSACSPGAPGNGHFVSLCSWLCNAGYYVTGSTCSPCSNSAACGAGQYRPLCTNGQYDNQTCSGYCTNKPLLNTFYNTPSIDNSGNGCGWGCNAGYFMNVSLKNCNLCQTSCASGLYISFACTNTSAGYTASPTCLACNGVGNATLNGSGTIPGNSSSCPFVCNFGYYHNNNIAGCTVWNVSCPVGYAMGNGTSTSNAGCIACQFVNQTSIYVYNVPNKCIFSCAAGYQPTSSACVGCASGTYKASIGNFACGVCAANTFQPSPAMSSCISVPSNGYAIANSTYYACNAGYVLFASPLTPFSCVACAVGQYGTSGTSCMQCPQGTFNAQSASSACSVCPMGTYSTLSGGGGASACSACGAGSFSNQVSVSVCTQCSAGTFNVQSVASVCQGCVAGSFSSGHAASVCSVCGAGSFSVSGATTCSPCLPGTFMSGGSASACGSCGTGTFAAGYGYSACLACVANCPLGYQLYPACTLTSNGSCLACTYPASSVYIYQVNTCTFSCGPGYYYSVNQTCAACSAGSYSTGSSGCVPCAVGTFQKANTSSQCLQCGSGQYASVSGLTLCSLCAPGTYSAGGGAIVCAGCASGTYATAWGGVVCISCAAGFVSGPGATYCYVYGSEIAYCQSGVCYSCNAGYYQSIPYTTVCTACAAGSYSTGSGIVDTVEWPSTVYSYSSAQTNADCQMPQLDANGGWCPVTLSSNEWIEMDLGSYQTVRGVVTQGRATAQQWVTGFSTLAITGTTNPTFQLTGNVDRYTRQVSLFSSPVSARYIKILSGTSYNGWFSLRCNALVAVQPICSSSTCKAGTYLSSINSSACSVCGGILPGNNAYYASGCTWLCNVGYYVNGSNVCSRCSNSSGCGSGQFRPNCTNGLLNNQTCSGQCSNKAQSVQAIYLGPSTDNSGNNCPWGCSSGYYKSAVTLTCVNCNVSCGVGMYASSACAVPQNQTFATGPVCLPCTAIGNATFVGSGIAENASSCPFNCVSGFYLVSKNSCVAWTANCPLLGYAWSKGTALSNAVCQACQYANMSAAIYVYVQNTCNFSCGVGYQLVGSGSCQACDPGKYKATIGGLCIACPIASSYQPSTGQGQCLNVPLNAVVNAQGSNFICNMGFYQFNNPYQGEICAACPGNPVQNALSVVWAGCWMMALTCNAGYYRNWTAPASCLACSPQPPPNSVWGMVNASSFCATCNSTSVLQDELMACPFTCNAGYYQHGYACVRCANVTCSGGLYAQMCTGIKPYAQPNENPHT